MTATESPSHVWAGSEHDESLREANTFALGFLAARGGIAWAHEVVEAAERAGMTFHMPERYPRPAYTALTMARRKFGKFASSQEGQHGHSGAIWYLGVSR